MKLSFFQLIRRSLEYSKHGIVYPISNNGICGRLALARGCRSSQAFGCSPIKRARELGSDRRETGRSLSAAGVDT